MKLCLFSFFFGEKFFGDFSQEQQSNCTVKLQQTTGLIQFCIEALKETDSAAFLQVSLIDSVRFLFRFRIAIVGHTLESLQMSHFDANMHVVLLLVGLIAINVSINLFYPGCKSNWPKLCSSTFRAFRTRRFDNRTERARSNFIHRPFWEFSRCRQSNSSRIRSTVHQRPSNQHSALCAISLLIKFERRLLGAYLRQMRWHFTVRHDADRRAVGLSRTSIVG